MSPEDAPSNSNTSHDGTILFARNVNKFLGSSMSWSISNNATGPPAFCAVRLIKA